MPTLNEVIEYFGYGKFGFYVTIVFSLQWFVFGIVMSISTILSPTLHGEWNLSFFETALISSTVYFGYAIGSIIVGWLSDKFGRKFMCIIGTLILIYYSKLSLFTDSVLWFSVSRFFVGVGSASALNGPCYLAEVLGIYQRAKAMVVLSLMFDFAPVFISLVALLVMQNYGWRVFLLLTALPSISLVPAFFWLPESVRYLQKIGRFDKVIKVLHQTSLLNKKEMPKKLDLNINKENVSHRSGSRLVEKQHLLTVIKASFVFLAASVIYYAASFLSTEIFLIDSKRTYHLLTKRDYFNILMIATVDILGTFILVLIADKLRRKTLLSIYFILAGIILTGYIIPYFADYATFITALGRFIAAPLSALAWVYIAESFPVTVRATTVGKIQLIGKFGIAAVPFLIQWLLHLSMFWVIIFLDTLCIFGIIGTILMPIDTKGEFIDQ